MPIDLGHCRDFVWAPSVLSPQNPGGILAHPDRALQHGGRGVCRASHRVRRALRLHRQCGHRSAPQRLRHTATCRCPPISPQCWSWRPSQTPPPTAAGRFGKLGIAPGAPQQMQALSVFLLTWGASSAALATLPLVWAHPSPLRRPQRSVPRSHAGAPMAPRRIRWHRGLSAGCPQTFHHFPRPDG